MRPTQSFQALLVVLFSLYSLSGCTTTELASSLVKSHSSSNGLYKVGQPYEVEGKTYYPSEVATYTEVGQASWYGPGFHGRQTANGEQFDTGDFTAAHRTLPMPSVVRVTNLENGNSVMVRINDRGPFKRDRIIDVSQMTAKALGFHLQGTTKVKVEFMPEESRMVAESAKNGHVMSLAEVQAKMSQRLAQQQVPEVMASMQSAPVANKAALTTVVSPIQPAMAAEPVQPVAKNVLRDPHAGQPRVIQASMTTAAPAAHHVYVQVGAYSKLAHAKAVGRKVQPVAASQKIDTIVRSGVKLYRVRLVAGSQADAQKMLGRVSAMGYGDAKLVGE